MINSSKHIVEKFRLEVRTPSEELGKQLEMQSLELVKQKLLPEMEKLFDRYDESQHIRLENLAFEIDVKESAPFEEQFVNQFLEQLSTRLENASNNRPNSKNETADLFQFFLQNGHFPWWSQGHSVADLEKQLLQNKKDLFSLSAILQYDPGKLKRLVLQFSDAFLTRFLNDEKLEKYALELQLVFSKYFGKVETRNSIWQAVFKAVYLKKLKAKKAKIYIFKTSINHFSAFQNSSKIQFAESILKDLKTVGEESFLTLQSAIQGSNWKENDPDLKTESDRKNQSAAKTDQKEWYIQNAGLVLLHPFLVMLFESLGFTEKNVFKNEHAQNQAALLLQYLVNKKSQHPENELVLNKIFCEIPLAMPIEKELILTEKIIEESEKLLNAVIKHWSALKNTSAEGLRNTFLQREGKLTKNEDGSWKLFVQHTTFDILISKLPWSISIIKLPWMKNMLQVEWA